MKTFTAISSTLSTTILLFSSLAWIPASESFQPSLRTFRALPKPFPSVKYITKVPTLTKLYEQTINNEERQNNQRSPLENLNLLQQKQKKGPAPPGFFRKRFPNFPWDRVPNWLTYARCAAIPLLMWYFYQPDAHVATTLVFAGASLTDYLDGYLARRWDSCSRFGAFLDPVADKLMVSTALVLLSGRYGMLLALPSSIILARELAVSALREWMAQLGLRDTVQVGWQGKCKTALTMVALTVLLLAPPLGQSTALVKFCVPTGLCLTYAATLLTITSGWVYFKAAAPYLMDKPRDAKTDITTKS